MKKTLTLVGGVGGSKLVLGLSHILDPDHLMIVVNTGDDEEYPGTLARTAVSENI